MRVLVDTNVVLDFLGANKKISKRMILLYVPLGNLLENIHYRGVSFECVL